MVNKLLSTVFDHIKNVDSVTNVSINNHSLIADVNDVDVNRLVCLGHVLGLTVICSSSYCNNRVIVTFNI